MTDEEIIQTYMPSQRSIERASLKVILLNKLWTCFQNTLFRCSWRFNKFRMLLLRIFGARLLAKKGSYVSIQPGVSIASPWNLQVGDLSSIGDNSWVYALDKLTIGEKTCIGEYVKLLTGYHDITTWNFQFKTKPITIGSCVWIATGATVLPGVTIGDGCVIGAHSVVNKDIPEGCIAVGSPARVIKSYSKESKCWERVDKR